jgi:AsmA protein
VSAEIVGRDRQLDLDLAAARVLGGTLAGNLRLDGSVLSEPDFALTAAANGVQLEPLLQVRFGSAPVSGTADISADLSGKGGDAKTVRESLSGSVSFLARDGRIRGIGIVGVIIRAAGGSDQDGEDMTVFSQLSGTAKGKHGRFRSDDIQGESPLLAVTGRGELDLPAERMDLKLTSILRESASGARIAELEGLPIPVRITGDWRRPEVKVDLGPVLREAGRRALGRGLDRRSDQLEDLERRIGIPGLEEGLRGLLGL